MREWSAVLLGAVVGAAAALYYMGNNREVEQQTRQVKAKSKKALTFVNNLSDTAGEMLKR